MHWLFEIPLTCAHRIQLIVSFKMEDHRYLKIAGTTLYFNTRDEIVKVKLERVAYIEADSNYCNVVFINGVKATLFSSLTAIENLIQNHIRDNSSYFIRIGKKYILNKQYIFQINIPHQKITFSDFITPGMLEISVAREALKKLKSLFEYK